MDEITKTNEIQQKTYRTLPAIALRGKVLFPNIFLNFDVGRPMSLSAVTVAQRNNDEIFITAQKNTFIDSPRATDLNSVGVIAKIKQIIRSSNGSMKLHVQAIQRAKVVEFIPNKDYFCVTVENAPFIKSENQIENEAHFRQAKKIFASYAIFEKRINKEMLSTVNFSDDSDVFIDNAVSVSSINEAEAQKLLDIDNSLDRLIYFEELFHKETQILQVEKEISSKVKENIDKSQKEFYLREQLRAIHNELGEGENEQEQLENSIKSKNLPEDIEKKCLKEIKRLEKINPSSPDYSIILNYLDWIKELPFSDSTIDTDDLKKAKEILDKDHFGLEKVKQRILEYLAVLKLTKQIQGPILCFVGPPGVGKTSVATSIARALNRKFVRMSLGGVKDEAEIRGHRKTYVGAMPGRIIYGLKNAGSNNPVFLLDEIDKLSSDIHGDPASALLEVLDPEQNVTFRDRFLEVPFDLSKVMFITTANVTDTIPYPLLDRMEIIEINGYTNEEKLQIAKKYLLPKQIKANGLTKKNLSVTDKALKEIIESYTMEAGVRNLEREIGSLVRKVATAVAENPNLEKQKITEKEIPNYLGVKKRIKDDAMRVDEIGASTGLAWTSVGGVTLTIEVGLMQGKGEIILTGKLGDVMKESARAAISYIKANAEKYGINPTDFENKDIHIHVPEGATPKDGPSAGITMATAILSAFIKKPVSKEVAMTGEITLRGRVLAIGGLKEKALAAYRQGIKKVIIPKANLKDLEEIPEKIRKEMEFIACSRIDEVFEKAVKF